MEDFFSNSYAEAKERFLNKAQKLNARLYTLPLEPLGPNNEVLSIDVAWLGSLNPKRVLLHSSGLHGVEGFAGSAVQLQLMENLPQLAQDQALIVVHALNPFGMAWLRRTNENNVDLNRNFILDADEFQGAPEVYGKLDPFINTPSPPKADFFWLKAAWSLIRFGFSPIRQALAGGQYEYERGLFFGGNALQPSLSKFRDWLHSHLNEVEQIVAVDVHTGLGKMGQESLFASTKTPSLPSTLPNRPWIHLTGANANAAPYIIKGSCDQLLKDLKGDHVFIVQELGTYPSVKILQAMRAENRAHHFTDHGTDHPIKQRMKEVFCPASSDWRKLVLERGQTLVDDLL